MTTVVRTHQILVHPEWNGGELKIEALTPEPIAVGKEYHSFLIYPLVGRPSMEKSMARRKARLDALRRITGERKQTEGSERTALFRHLEASKNTNHANLAIYHGLQVVQMDI
jgi:hypothetical protein